MDKKSDTTRGRWGQQRRLAFIDLRLQYDGHINRLDLQEHFGISAPQATLDLAAYNALGQDSLAYDLSSRVYLPGRGFAARFASSEPAAYLGELYRLQAGIIERDDSFVGFVPQTGVVATPSRTLQPKEVSTFIQAIRDRASLEISYQSMRKDTASTRSVSPHALGFDGLRWHVRAWCHTQKVFRDFALGRVLSLGPSTMEAVDPSLDADWSLEVLVVLIPHPKLSPAQKRVVMNDYGMDKSGCYALTCRKAMLLHPAPPQPRFE